MTISRYHADPGEFSGTWRPAPPGNVLSRAAPPAAVRRLLRKAVLSTANVLLTGDIAAGWRYLGSVCPDGALRYLTARRINREGIGSLTEGDGGETVVFLDRVEDLHRWIQSALLDFLETGAGAGTDRAVRKIVSACHLDAADLLAAGALNRSLYLRLATLPVHIPVGSRTGPSGGRNSARVTVLPGSFRP